VVAGASEAALRGLRVLDLSSGVAGQFCGKLLAGYGADCVLVEPPEGTPTRRLGPYVTGGTSSTRSALFRHLNQGKASLSADVAGRSAPDLAGMADVVIRDDTMTLPFSLPATAIECVIGDFPRAGRYRDWQGTEMVHQALSGTMFMTGWTDRQPLYGTGHRAYYACGTTAFISVLAALHERERSGLGQQVTATVFEANAAIGQNLVSQYSYNGSYETRRRYPGFLALLECSDYWMVLFAIRHWDQLCAVFGLEHLLNDERFAEQADRLENWDLVVAQMQERARFLSAGALVAALQKARISAEVIAPLGRLVSSPQWRARQAVQVASDTKGRTEVALRQPFAVGDTEYSGVRPSPQLRRGRTGEREARQVQRRWRGLGPAYSGSAPPGRDGSGIVGSGAGPLSGLRVLDLTTAWAGPFAARSLAHLGAEVIKIDAPSHTDSWRGAPGGGAARHYPGGQPGRHPWNRCLLFNTQGQGKLSLGLDLKIDGAREIMLRLADVSDVLISNFTPGVLERLGIGYDALSARNPGIIVVEMPAFGPGGPDSAHQGMGKTMEPACGMTALMGYGDGQPVLTGPAYLDPIGGLSAVAATMAALLQRDAAGRGCRVEVPQTEAGAHWIGEQVLLQAETGQSWQPDGNAVSYAAPHDAYSCQGADEWIAIAAGTDAQWRALCNLMERPDLGTSPRYADRVRRARHHDELQPIIARWTRQFGKQELADALQAAGVPAAPVNNGRDVASDPVLLETGFIRELVHPEAGRHAYPSLSYNLARTPGGIGRAAPCFGEHNEFVLHDILGLTGEHIARLQEAGAISDRPLGAQTTAASVALPGAIDDHATARRDQVPVALPQPSPTSRGAR
jgi:crotonobetainyl-CoA:carnitine CoA-transferase CaiB-like acyl-CoA transferase